MKIDLATQSISVVIPMHNEELLVEEVLKQVSESCACFYSFQIVVVDDGSTDKTWEVLQKIAVKQPNVLALRFSRNFGHQRAVLAGLHQAKGDVVAIIDGDLQDPPRLIPEMVLKMYTHSLAMVYGQRISRHGETLFKTFSARFFYRIFSRMVQFDLPIDVGDFRVFRREILQHILSSKDPSPFLRGLFAYSGLPSGSFLYERNARASGATKYNVRKMFKFAMDGILGFSDAPFRLFIRFALVTLFFAITFSVFAISHALIYGSLPGWVSLFLLNLYMGSLNFFFLSLLGRYITFGYEISLDRPRWVISDQIN